GRRLRLALVHAVVVVLDVVAGDLQVANLRPLDPDTADAVVADVATDDVDLVQVQLIHVDAHARVVIHVAVGDQHVAVAAGEADPVPHVVDQHAHQRGLHGADQFDTVGPGILGHD